MNTATTHSAISDTRAGRRTVQLLQVPIDLVRIPDVLSRVRAALERQIPQVVLACANPHSLVVARRNPEFSQALSNADTVLADGAGIMLMSRLLRLGIETRITGSDCFLEIMRLLEQIGGRRIFLFGSSEEVLERMVERITADYPAVVIAGTCSPPFGEWSSNMDSQMVAQINAARTDVLWVGMTAPKQECWVERNRVKLDVPVIASIGAVFDFCAGTKRRAPAWMCRIGLEWIYRLAREPRRLLSRTAVSAPQFLWLACVEAMTGTRSSGNTDV